jgi:DNA-binding IclR family transcriptional regulator
VPPESQPAASNQRTQAVRRAVDILKLFTLGNPELSLQEVSERLHIAAPSVHRLLQTLEDEGLVSRISGTDLYRLGPLLPALGTQMLNQYPVRRLAAPHLRRLSHELEQTVALSRYQDGQVLYLECVESLRPICLVVRPGARAPAHCVASGRAMLGFVDRAEVEFLLERGLARCSPQTITSPDALRSELSTIRQRGFALDNGDYLEGLRAAAAPVLDATGQPVAGVTAICLASEVSMQRLREIAKVVVQTARNIGDELGLGTGLAKH